MVYVPTTYRCHDHCRPGQSCCAKGRVEQTRPQSSLARADPHSRALHRHPHHERASPSTIAALLGDTCREYIRVLGARSPARGSRCRSIELSRRRLHPGCAISVRLLAVPPLPGLRLRPVARCTFAVVAAEAASLVSTPRRRRTRRTWLPLPISDDSLYHS